MNKAVSIKICYDKGGSSSTSLMTLNGKRRGRLYWAISFLATIALSIHNITFLGFFGLFQQLSVVITTEPSIERTHEPGLHIILSHCSVPLDWIFDDEHTSVDHGVNITLKSITIISKCGNPPFLDAKIQFPNETRVDILQLPNVGRCDHSYAYWIEKMLYDHQNNGTKKQWYHPNDFILFTKDSARKIKRRRSLESMMDGTKRRGIYCGGKTWIPRGRNFAIKNVLGAFQLDGYKDGGATPDIPFQSPHRPMSAWVESLPVNISYKSFGIVNVCWSGMFMTTQQQIVDAPVANWSAMVESLSRGDSIEEGHYMERLWGGLLAPPVSSEQLEQLIGQMTIETGMDGVILMKEDENEHDM